MKKIEVKRGIPPTKRIPRAKKSLEIPKIPKAPRPPKRAPKQLTKKEKKLLVDHVARGRERVLQASLLGRWGEHPGKARLMCELRVYYPTTNCYHLIPGWNLKVILEPQELDNLKHAIQWGVQKWIEGKLTEKGFMCPGCGEREK